MIAWDDFARLLARFARCETVVPDDTLFGAGLDLSSIGFTEFIMELEEDYGIDIDVDELDASIKTAGQLYDRINSMT